MYWKPLKNCEISVQNLYSVLGDHITYLQINITITAPQETLFIQYIGSLPGNPIVTKL